MTIQQLQYVVALDTHRHFVKAAESCHVTQPTLTLQVKKLEKQISAVLFDRSCQPLEPTAIGELFILKARRILQEIDELKETVNGERDQTDGIFRVGIIPTLAPSLLPLFIADFINKHPQTRLVIEELQSESIIEALHNKQLDLALIVTPLNEPDLREVPLFYEPFLLYTDVNNSLLQRESISPEQLKPDGLWVLRQGHCFRNQTLNICEFDVSEHHRNLIMEGGSIGTLKRLINEVTGYTLIPELAYDHENDSKQVIQFEEPKPVREVSIVVHKHFTKEKLITELKRTILEHTPDSFKKNERYMTVVWR